MIFNIVSQSAGMFSLLWVVLHLIASVLLGLLLAAPARMSVVWAIVLSVCLPGVGPLILMIMAIAKRVPASAAPATPYPGTSNAVLFGVKVAETPHAGFGQPQPQPAGWPAAPAAQPALSSTPQLKRAGSGLRIAGVVVLALLAVAYGVTSFLPWIGLSIGTIGFWLSPSNTFLIAVVVVLVLLVGVAVWLGWSGPSNWAGVIATIVATQLLFLCGGVMILTNVGAGVAQQIEAAGGGLEKLISDWDLEQLAKEQGIDLQEALSGGQGTGAVDLDQSVLEQLGLGEIDVEDLDLDLQSLGLEQLEGVDLNGINLEDLVAEGLDLNDLGLDKLNLDSLNADSLGETAQNQLKHMLGGTEGGPMIQVSFGLQPAFWVALAAAAALLLWTVIETVLLFSNNRGSGSGGGQPAPTAPFPGNVAQPQAFQNFSYPGQANPAAQPFPPATGTSAPPNWRV